MDNKEPSKFVASTLPPELLQGIGEIVVRWSFIQWQLANIIIIGFDLPKDTGRALTSGMTMNVLNGIVRTLTFTDRWIKSDIVRAEIRKLSEDIRDSYAKRNNYAHSIFIFEMENPDSFFRYLSSSSEHRINPSFEEINPEKLKEIAEEARLLIEQAMFLSMKLRGQMMIQASQEKASSPPH